MSKTLNTQDIRDLLVGFAAAIELDQIRVDALPPRKFHHHYSPSLWRTWRRSFRGKQMTQRYVDYVTIEAASIVFSLMHR